MNTFLLSLIAPAIWAASNHFNKYLVTRYMPGARVGAIVIFAALVGVVTLPLSFVLQHEAFQLRWYQSLLIALNGALYLCALTPFLKALQISDASTAIPILQSIPVFSFVLAWIFLGETLSSQQLIGGLSVIIGALLISLKGFAWRNLSVLAIRTEVLSLMLLCSLIYATAFLLFKVFALRVEFWSSVFWESIGFIAYAIGTLAWSKTYRDDFLSIFPQNRVATLLAITNEVINIFAKILFNKLSLFVPITIAWIGVSFQPVFVLLYSVLLTTMFPSLGKEDISGPVLTQKVLAILLMVLGACVMNGL